MKLRVRALPHGQPPHPFFRRAGRTFFLGADVVDDFDEATEALLMKEVDRLKVERVPDDTPSASPAVTRAPAEPMPGPKTELAADGSTVPMVGGVGSKGRPRS